MKKAKILLSFVAISMAFGIPTLGKVAKAEEENPYTFYASSSGSFSYEDGSLISTSSGEQKAIYNEDIGKTFDISFTIATMGGNFNGGLYFWASEASNTADGIDAYNVEIQSASQAGSVKIYLYEFTNGKYINSFANTVNLEDIYSEFEVRVILSETDLNVYLNGSNIPSLNKKVKSLDEKTGNKVGFRSQFQAQEFSNIQINEFTGFPEAKTVKVLMIANSYGEDTMTYCHEIARAAGVNMVCGVIFYGGCTVKQHATFIENKSAVYTYFKNGGTDSKNCTFDDILFDEDWNYITIQTGNGEGGIESTFYPHIHKIISYVEGKMPRAEIGLFEMWALPACYERQGNSRLGKYGDSAERMYEAIAETQQKLALDNGIPFIVPSNEALYRMNDTDVCDWTRTTTSFHRDSTGHCNEKGRYLLGCAMFETITGYSVYGNTYVPFGYSYGNVPGIDEYTMEVVQEVVDELFLEYPTMDCFGEPEVESLEVIVPKTTYSIGEYFDYANINVDAIYSDGYIDEGVKNFTIDLMRPLTADDTKVTISYHGASFEVRITVR